MIWEIERSGVQGPGPSFQAAISTGKFQGMIWGAARSGVQGPGGLGFEVQARFVGVQARTLASARRRRRTWPTTPRGSWKVCAQ